MTDAKNNDKDGTAIDRRHFGKLLAAGVGGLAIGLPGGVLAQRTETQGIEPPEAMLCGPRASANLAVDAVVVGAGLSGLIAARDLVAAKKSVLVLEARSRPGGRMYRMATTQGGVLDLGGQWVGPTQDAMLGLMEALNIQKFDSYHTGRDLLSWKRGIPTAADIAAADQVWNKLLAISARVPAAAPWETPDAKWLDSQTLQTWLDKETTNEYAKWNAAMMARIGGSGGFEPGQASLLHMAWTQKVGPQSEKPETWLLRGGAGQIPPMLAAQLGKRILYCERVTGIEHGGKGVTITTTGLTITAGAVIVAIPPPLRAAIIFSPPLPAVHSGLIQHAPMGSMSKVHAVYETAFWRDRGLSGTASGDLDTCEFIADSSPPGGRPGILTSFIAGDRNVQVSSESAATVKNAVLDNFKYYFGVQAQAPLDFIHYNWNTQNWTTGAFTAYMPPGVWPAYGKGLRTPVNHIFWAGTETADKWPGYFDGAIRAGVRAAKEAVAALVQRPVAVQAQPLPA